MMKFVSRVFLMLTLFSSLALIAAVHVFAEAPGVIVVIGSDTTWTKADGPHELTGPILVNQGVTLTVEVGATVNLNGYELRVNGTLRAMGTSSDQILFTTGSIMFTEFSTPWDAQTGTGSIIQFAILDDVQIVNSVPVSVNENPVGDNTVWTKEDSPVEFTSLVVVGAEEVLTIESGVTVNMNGYDLIVKGTLRVFGDKSDKVHFNGGVSTARIHFTEASNGWDEQTATGCVIDHATLDRVNVVSNNSLKIANSNITFRVWIDKSSVLVDNTLSILLITGGSVVCSNNEIGRIEECHGSPELFDNTIDLIVGSGGSPVISGNSIKELGMIVTGKDVETRWFTAESPTITSNTIHRGIYLVADSATITNNIITGYTFNYTYLDWIIGQGWVQEYTANATFTTSGITLRGSGYVEGNTVSGCDKGIEGGTKIVRNFLVDNEIGVLVRSPVIIQNNTFKANRVGIELYQPASTISYNNFEDNTQNSIHLFYLSDNIDASNNWWGTSDTQAINLTIHDYKYEFGLGKVNFIPFLSGPNQEAVPTEIPEFPALMLLPLFLVVTCAVVFVRKRFMRGNSAK
jgi:hypothetical protein